MLFNSVEYLVFFSLALTASWLTVGLPRLRIWLLLLASYYFYASNSHWYIFLILFSTQIDYLAGRAIHATQNVRKRKSYLTLSLVTNLGFLGLFKYRSEEHTSELQSHSDLVCRLLLEKKKQQNMYNSSHNQ